MVGKHDSVESIIAAYGAAAKSKLGAIGAQGEPEDQLRSPLETLVADLAEHAGLHRAKLALVGESLLAELKTRPDFAVVYDEALIGYVEVKAPGKGADPRRFRDRHDRDQWKKLAALPNLLYTDGNDFSLWRDGELVDEIQRLDGDVATSGAELRPRLGLLGLFDDFLRWQPLPPRSARELALTTARRCRLLRDEVTEQMDRGVPALTSLANEWRHLLFPTASDAEFADGYAQAVTFGLLLARARDIDLEHGIDVAARQLGASHSLIGRALSILTGDTLPADTLATSVATLTRVLAVVDWPTVSKGDPEVWLYFYELFLEEYDSDLRRRTGSYYTPAEVVESMTRLVDEALRTRFELPGGLSEDLVTVIDPAMGTGTFLLSVLRSIARTLTEDLGEGAVPAALRDVIRRVIGFELQLGPFAVAQLRVLAELAELAVDAGTAPGLRMFVTNTLDNPFVEDETLGVYYEPVARSRREANQIKKGEPVFVVLGNPPYRERSLGTGAWIEAGNPGSGEPAPLRHFIPPPEWGVGAHVKHVYNPYVYFWRWATWKVFDHHPDQDRGVICLITVAGFLEGPGFEAMRRYLRQRSDAIWVLDCSPEGHQPPVNTRVFQGVQQPICIVLAVRDGSTGDDQPAPVRYRELAEGTREAKFQELANVTLVGGAWRACSDDWRAPFVPAAGGRWASFPLLDDLLHWSGSGVMPGRTWVIAPDSETLGMRWDRLVGAKKANKPDLLSEHPNDRRVDTVLRDNLPGYEPRETPIGEETGPCPEPVRIGYRSFDRQWIIPDKRVINRPNPTLWRVRSQQQVYLTALTRTSPASGPGITFSALVPDLDHYHGRGGRAYPLWLDDQATEPNVRSALLDALSGHYEREVTAPELFGYLAGICAHPAYTATFREDLAALGIRVPLTADRRLFREVSDLGRRVIWLHSYGQRSVDSSAGRPHSAPRLPSDRAPRVAADAPIPGGEMYMPDELRYDGQAQRLHMGSGAIEHVTLRMWEYDVSGVNVLGKWFSYRRKTRDRPVIGARRVSPLLEVQSTTWRAEYTRDLIDMLNVLGLLEELEPAQAKLLDRILAGPLLTVADLRSAGALAAATDDDQRQQAPHTGEQAETLF